jgi:hypothetical protein
MEQIALALAQKGWRVFPCSVAGKVPVTEHGHLDATVDVVAIHQWWSEKDYNIGIACGAASGIFVVDIDGGEAELGRLEAQHGELPPTVEVITSRGRHLYFKYPNVSVPNSAGKICTGVDVRGEGGYVVAAGSMHPDGRRYRWSVDSASVIAEAPRWLIDLITAPTSGNGVATPAFEWRTLVANGVVEGQRNTTIAKLAGLLLRRFVDPIVTLELLQAWNMVRCSPPLSPEDIERVVDSIAGRELRRRSGG